jgi:hypothetical protein
VTATSLLAIALVAGASNAARADAAPPREGDTTPDAAPADAAPAPRLEETTANGAIHRVVLVNSGPDLAHAARAALAPWTIEVIEETRPAPPADDAAAIELGRERGADRVAWLAGGELIVVDPATGASARRPAPDGAGDPAAAASVALTLKTVLRLPPPTVAVVEEPPPPQIDDQVPDEPPGERIRVVPEVGGAVRMWFGGSIDVQPRATVALGFVHPSFPRWRPSLVGSFGPAVEGGRGSFRGEYADVELGAQLALELPLSRAWSIVPRARVTVHRIHISGRLPMMETFDAHDTSVEAGADVAGWWRSGGFRAGAGVGAAALLGLPDYERQNSTVFESPSLGIQLFLTVLIAL